MRCGAHPVVLSVGLHVLQEKVLQVLHPFFPNQSRVLCLCMCCPGSKAGGPTGICDADPLALLCWQWAGMDRMPQRPHPGGSLLARRPDPAGPRRELLPAVAPRAVRGGHPAPPGHRVDRLCRRVAARVAQAAPPPPRDPRVRPLWRLVPHRPFVRVPESPLGGAGGIHPAHLLPPFTRRSRAGVAHWSRPCERCPPETAEGVYSPLRPQ